MASMSRHITVAFYTYTIENITYPCEYSNDILKYERGEQVRDINNTCRQVNIIRILNMMSQVKIAI